MIAFKTYNDCPVEKRPNNIPLSWPWQEQSCSVDEKENLEFHGFTVLSENDYDLYKAQYQTEIDAWIQTNTKVPSSVSPRQIRIALIMTGFSLDLIENTINSLPEPDKSIVRVTWEYSVEFQRNNAVLLSMAPVLGLSDSQIDDLFRLASTL